MNIPWRLFSLVGGWVCLVAGGGLGTAVAQGIEEAEDPHWPCEQALVPVVAEAVVWDGPPLADLQQGWRDVPAVVGLVGKITSPHGDAAEANEDIEAFARGLQAKERDRMLTLLFAGVLETLNADRGVLIEGIKRYSRDQARRARLLDDDLAELIRLERMPAEEAAVRMQELQKKLEWEQRIFDERERSIQYLCSRPVAVEQRLGLLARTIAGYLD